MKTNLAFAVITVLGVATYIYTMWMPGAHSSSHISSPESGALDRNELYRLILFGMAVLCFASSFIAAFRRPPRALFLWILLLVIVAVRALIPGYPRPSSLPMAAQVFWSSMAVQLLVCVSALRNPLQSAKRKK